MGKTTAKSSKADVIVALQELLRQKTVKTQEDICVALKKKGFPINQAKVSRLLHRIGAVKMTENEETVYCLPAEQMTVSPKDTLKQLILNVSHNETTVVIQTAPASAQLVARLLDLKQQPAILGTVAGDDTIFIAPVSVKEIKSLFEQIYRSLLA
ncbi:MAG TPA: arginine repressor [Gammaproteobacteria bacterium]|nr:arginine repressor [Gammaproteobacteria bacterium]